MWGELKCVSPSVMTCSRLERLQLTGDHAAAGARGGPGSLNLPFGFANGAEIGA